MTEAGSTLLRWNGIRITSGSQRWPNAFRLSAVSSGFPRRQWQARRSRPYYREWPKSQSPAPQPASARARRLDAASGPAFSHAGGIGATPRPLAPSRCRSTRPSEGVRANPQARRRAREHDWNRSGGTVHSVRGAADRKNPQEVRTGRRFLTETRRGPPLSDEVPIGPRGDECRQQPSVHSIVMDDRHIETGHSPRCPRASSRG